MENRTVPTQRSRRLSPRMDVQNAQTRISSQLVMAEQFAWTRDSISRSSIRMEHRSATCGPSMPSPFNLWMNTPYKPDGMIDWLPTVSKKGDYIVFRAELDCLVVMSACPQDLVPVNGKDCIPHDLHFEVS